MVSINWYPTIYFLGKISDFDILLAVKFSVQKYKIRKYNFLRILVQKLTYQYIISNYVNITHQNNFYTCNNKVKYECFSIGQTIKSVARSVVMPITLGLLVVFMILIWCDFLKFLPTIWWQELALIRKSTNSTVLHNWFPIWFLCLRHITSTQIYMIPCTLICYTLENVFIFSRIPAGE